MWFDNTVVYLGQHSFVIIIMYSVILIVLLLALLKLYNWLTTSVYRGTISMIGKTVIITGSNSGKMITKFAQSIGY